MKVKLDPKSRRAVISIKDIKNRSQEGIRKAFYFVGRDLKKTSSDMILEKPKHGRLYKLKRKGVTILHRASKKGEAPANLSGDLRKALDYEVKGSDSMEFGVRQSFPGENGRAGVEYGKYLEKDRPYLKPSILKNRGNAVQHFNREMNMELKK